MRARRLSWAGAGSQREVLEFSWNNSQQCSSGVGRRRSLAQTLRPIIPPVLWIRMRRRMAARRGADARVAQLLRHFPETPATQRPVLVPQLEGMVPGDQ